MLSPRELFSPDVNILRPSRGDVIDSWFLIASSLREVVDPEGIEPPRSRCKRDKLPLHHGPTSPDQYIASVDACQGLFFGWVQESLSDSEAASTAVSRTLPPLPGPISFQSGVVGIHILGRGTSYSRSRDYTSRNSPDCSYSIAGPRHVVKVFFSTGRVDVRPYRSYLTVMNWAPTDEEHPASSAAVTFTRKRPIRVSGPTL